MSEKLSLRTKLLSFLNIVVVAILMILAAWRQPIWLDEQYSLFFAKTFSPTQLLVHYTIDANPGLYYLYLKFLLLFSHNLLVLRLISSIIPALLGLGSLLWLGKIDLSKKYLLYFGPLIFLNPFVITMAWQLRLYGLVIMLVCFFYVIWERWLVTRNDKYLRILALLLIASTLVQYVFIWVTFVTAGLVIVKTRSKYWLWSLGIVLSVLLEFAISSGPSLKQKLTHISWIPQPSLATVSSVYSTVLGLKNDYFSTHLDVTIIDIFFDLIILLVFIWILRTVWEKKQELFIEKNQTFLSLILYGLIPPALLLGASLLFPIFSHLPIFYHFVPNISFLVPRVLISFVVFCSLYGVAFLKRDKHKILLIFIAVFWLFNAVKFNILNSLPLIFPNESTQVLEIIQKNPNALLFPSWLYIESINPKNIDEFSTLKTQISQSLPLEDQLSNSTAVCQIAKGKDVFAEQFITASLEWESQKIANQLARCCMKMESANGFDKWTCRH